MKTFWLRVKKGWKLVLLYLLISLTYSYAMFQGGFVSWFLFTSFFPFGLYGLLLALYPLRDFTISRVIEKKEYSAGETIHVTVTLQRRIPFPLFFLLVEDGINSDHVLLRNKDACKTLSFPGFKRRIVWKYEWKGVPRGEHLFQHVRIVTGDPLGLVEKVKEVKIRDQVMVYPLIEEMPYRPLESQYEQGTTASNERVQRDTSMAVGIREYQPGDRFSWINWKATARRNEIMTKEFEQRKSHDVLIVMDCEPNPHFETVVSYTASLLKAILRKGAGAGLLLSGSECLILPIRSGEKQLLESHYQLAKVKSDSKVSLEMVMDVHSHAMLQSENLMLVTGKLTKGLVDIAGRYASNRGTLTIFLVKKSKDMLSQNEMALRSAAIARGVRVISVQERHFSDVFSRKDSRTS